MAFWIMLIWVLFIWYFFQEKMSVKKLCADGVYDYKVSNGYLILLFCVPFLIIAVRSDFIDTSSYISEYLNIPKNTDYFETFVNKRDHSQLYYGITFLVKQYVTDNANVWLAIVAGIQSVLMLYTFKKYSCDAGMSVVLFISTGLCASWMCNGIRQFVAVTILFALTDLIIKNKWYIYVPIAIFLMGLTPITSRLGLENAPWYLCGIHQSVLIAIPTFFCIQGKVFNKKVWILVLVFLVLIVTGGLGSVLDSSVENTTYASDMEYVNEDTGTSIFRVSFCSLPAVFAALSFQKINEKTTPKIIALSANASIVTAILYIASAFTSGIYVGRLPIYTEMYNFILMPWIYKHGIGKENKIIRYVMACVYIVYFYYQFNVVWDGYYQSEILGLGV